MAAEQVTLPDRADVLVVGAGYTGLNAARVIAESGASVVVVDRGTVGAGASSVNGGMVNYGLKAATTKVYRAYGETLGREFWDASLASIDLVEALVSTERIDCHFHRGGAAELGYNDRDLETFRHEAEWLADRVGFAMDVIGPDRIGGIVGSPTFHCALVDSVGAGLHPARYVDGLADAARRRGATIVEHAGVETLERDGAGYRATTFRGIIRAGEVLVATNGYTDRRPLPGLKRRVIPIGSYIVVTEPLDDATAERLIPGRRMMWTARRFLNYFRRTPDNRVLMGGRNNLSNDLDLTESAGILGSTTAEIFPELARVPLTHSWTGTLGVTFDLMPHIGRIDGVWYALGYGGHGVGIATYLGTEVGNLIAGNIDRSPFAEIPHPTRPYYQGNPWFLPFAKYWYRFLDALGR